MQEYPRPPSIQGANRNSETAMIGDDPISGPVHSRHTG